MSMSDEYHELLESQTAYIDLSDTCFFPFKPVQLAKRTLLAKARQPTSGRAEAANERGEVTRELRTASTFNEVDQDKYLLIYFRKRARELRYSLFICNPCLHGQRKRLSDTYAT